MKRTHTRHEGGGLSLALSLGVAIAATMTLVVVMTRTSVAQPAAPASMLDGGATGDASAPFLDGLKSGSLVTVTFEDHPLLPVSATFELNGSSMTLDLVTHSVRSPRYQAFRQAADGTIIETEPGPVNTLRGVVRGVAGSKVAGGMMGEWLTVAIRQPGVETLWLEPVALLGGDGDDDRYVVYSSDDLLPIDGVCGVGPLANHARPVNPGSVAGTDGLQCAEIVTDADTEFFASWGSLSEARINTVINAMNPQFEDEVNITHVITAVMVRESEPDPYTTSDAPVLVNQFRSEWLSGALGGIPRDCGQLFTGKDIFTADQGNSTIGLALDIGSVCTGNAYSVVENFARLICATDLSAHELGHLWDGVHCTCPNNTMNASLTCANQFNATFTIPDIEAYRDAQTCLDCPILAPPNDNCEMATPVPAGVTPFTTIEATTDGPAEPDCPSSQDQTDNDVWFNFFATCDGDLTVGTCGATFNTKIVIYEFDVACPSAPGTFIACNDNGCSVQSLVNFPVMESTIYRIRVGGVGGLTGTGELSIQLQRALPDDCPCDFNESGAITVDDLLALLAAWGTPGADCTDDGDTTVDDLLALLAGWGDCP